MRDFRQAVHRGLFLLCAILSTLQAEEKFNQTTGTKVDSSKFGGLSEDEVKSLQNSYNQAISARIKTFDDGNKSSGVGGKGRYSNFGEAHVQDGTAMVSHEGGANALEKAIEKGALGRTGLTGQARVEANQREMEKRTKPVKDEYGNITHYVNSKGEKMENIKEISAALYDAGAAHGNPDDAHRVYAVKADVRKNVEGVAKDFARLTIQDATKQDGARRKPVQANLDLLHKEYSKLEQDKYLMMATDAFAFRAARLAGVDTSRAINKNSIGEFKQIAIDVYADEQYAGKIEQAEPVIRKKIAERVAQRRVVNDAVQLCLDGSVARRGECNTGAGGGDGRPVSTTADPDMKSSEEAAREVLQRLNSSTDGANIAAIQEAIKSQFTPKEDGTVEPVKLSRVLDRLEFKDFAGVVDSKELSNLYAKAEQKLNSEEKGRISEYKSRLDSNGCLSFETICYSPGFGDDKLSEASKNRKDEAAERAGIEANAFMPIKGQDPGDFFNDTRELIFNNFAYTYFKPLDTWKNNVTNADFSKDTDAKIQSESYAKGQDAKVRDGKLYKEFGDMHKYALDQAKSIQQGVDQRFKEKYRAAGATPEQVARISPNYSVVGPNNFDAKSLSMMELFGQNKARDAFAIDARLPGGGFKGDPNTQNNGASPFSDRIKNNVPRPL